MQCLFHQTYVLDMWSLMLLTFLGAYINDFCPNGVRLNVMFYVVEVLTSAVFGSRLLTFVCILSR